jgi:parallel beta-helix repeat protein
MRGGRHSKQLLITTPRRRRKMRSPKHGKAIVPVVLFLGIAVGAISLHLITANAGDLEPTAPPGPTMKTLDEVEPGIAIKSVPYHISSSGSYYFTGDLTSAVYGIHVSADDVTIDLMGYTLAYGASTVAYGIYINGRSNVEIRNGTVRDFGGAGIREATSAGRRHRVINVRVEACGEDGIRLDGEGHLVKDCAVADNQYDGIEVGSGSTVTGCICYNNQRHGIDAALGCTVSDNTVYNNQYDGIDTQQSCTVSGNTAKGNQNDGIHAGSGSTVSGNTTHNNAHCGIIVDHGCTVTGNTAYNNERTGIYSGTGSTITDNTVRGNNLTDSGNHSGIRVASDCVVKGNTLTSNKQRNIYVYSARNVIEGNLVNDSTGYGIHFYVDGNFYANNRASDNDTEDYYNGGLQTDGGGNYSF